MALCALCDNTHITMRLCADCKADPANRDWHEGDGETVDDVDAALARAGKAHARLSASIAGRKLRKPTRLQMAILQHALIKTPWRYCDPRGNSHQRWRALTIREIARKVNCSHFYVWWVIMRHVA